MTTIRFIYRSFWRNGTILAQSTEHPQFPADNTQDDCKTLAWRSRYGTGTGNGRFVVGASNKYIDFDEGGAELTATITPATYNGQTLATEIKTQMDAAGGTYTVTYSEATGKFTIYRAAGNFTIRWLNGTNTANNAAGLLGFDKTANDTGADTYTGDYVSIHTSESIDCDLGAAYEYDFVGILGHNLTASAVVTFYGADDSAISSNVVNDVPTYCGNNMYFFLAASRTKHYTRCEIVDPKNPSGYVQIGVVVVGKYFAPNRNFGSYSEGESDETEMEKSPSMNLFMVQERPKLINWELPFTGLDTASVASIRLMLANNGVSKALIFCTDTTAANSNSNWAHFKELSLPECQQIGYWVWECALEEVL